MSQGGRWRRGKCVRGCMALPCKGRVTKLSNSSCDKAVVRCSIVVVGQSDQVSMRRTNVGEREIHGEPFDSELVYKGDWKGRRSGVGEDPKFRLRSRAGGSATLWIWIINPHKKLLPFCR